MPMVLVGGEVYGPFGNSRTVEEYVYDYFADIPVMIDVAYCESRFRQFDGNGDLLHGEENTSDLGVMQINKWYHEDTASNLGLDIRTLDGNLEYARNLFEREGTTPWLSSSPCWGLDNHIAMR